MKKWELSPKQENLILMGKDKLKRFSELNTFTHVLQPHVNEIKPAHKIKGNWNLEFKNEAPIVLELGCGKGEYTVGLAKQYPSMNFYWCRH